MNMQCGGRGSGQYGCGAPRSLNGIMIQHSVLELPPPAPILPVFWLVLGFEATLPESTPEQGGADLTWPREIVEFSALLVDTHTCSVVSEFWQYCRPSERPEVTKRCSDLTGISQQDVDGAPSLSQVLTMFDAWLLQATAGTVESGTVLPVLCGEWELRTCLPQECARKGLLHAVPPVLAQWCNLKSPFAVVVGGAGGGKAMGQWTLASMHSALGLPQLGQQQQQQQQQPFLTGMDSVCRTAQLASAIASRAGSSVITATATATGPDLAVYRGSPTSCTSAGGGLAPGNNSRVVHFQNGEFAFVGPPQAPFHLPVGVGGPQGRMIAHGGGGMGCGGPGGSGGGGGGNSPMSPGSWQCGFCGWRNRATNNLCGGLRSSAGIYGCGTPRMQFSPHMAPVMGMVAPPSMHQFPIGAPRGSPSLTSYPANCSEHKESAAHEVPPVESSSPQQAIEEKMAQIEDMIGETSPGGPRCVNK
jgi:inhibitor of KinA sporulation pathway (predicted exonuclease)